MRIDIPTTTVAIRTAHHQGPDNQAIDNYLKYQFVNNNNDENLIFDLNPLEARSNIRDREEVLLSDLFVKTFSIHLPANIKKLTILGGNFSQWTKEFDMTMQQSHLHSLDRVTAPLASNTNPLLTFIQNIPAHITEIDLSKSILSEFDFDRTKDIENQNSFYHLHAILSVLTRRPNLTMLGLDLSQLYHYDDEHQSLLWQLIPRSLNTICISNKSLKQHFVKLNTKYLLKNKTSPCHYQDIQTSHYPRQIKTFVISSEDIKQENAMYFIKLMKSLNSSVDETSVLGDSVPSYQCSFTILSIDNCNLYEWCIEQQTLETPYQSIDRLWQSIPKEIKLISLKNNDLALLSYEQLIRFFEHFPKDVVLELSNNQFNQLSFTKLNQAVSALPNTQINFEDEYFFIRQDKKIICDPSIDLNAPSLVRFHQIKLHRNPASLWIDVLKSKEDKGITTTDVNHFLSYIPIHSEILENQSRLIELMSSPLEQSISSSIDQDACYGKVLARLELFLSYNRDNENKKSTLLDLSFARLGHLSFEQLKTIFSMVPLYVSHLRLSHNDFHLNKTMQKNLWISLHELPHIKHQTQVANVKKNKTIFVELSGNHFSTLSYQYFAAIGLQHRNTHYLKVSFTIDMPATPNQQSARFKWLDHYKTKSHQVDNILDFARRLMGEYTMGDNFWLLIVTLHWGRNHYTEVRKDRKKLSMRHESAEVNLDCDHIDNTDDLLARLNRYKEHNAAGDFAYRLAPLLLFSENRPAIEIPEEIAMMQDNRQEGIELSSQNL